jgi:protein-L-isoaspartate O-methyltransferase
MVPGLSEVELADRISEYPFHVATHLTARNLTKCIGIRDDDLRFWFSQKFAKQRKGLSEVIELEGFSGRMVKCIREVPKEFFATEGNRKISCWNDLVWIGLENCVGTTPPWLCAYGLEQLKPKENILIAGFGYGYFAALAGEYMKNDGEIYGMEIDGKVISKAKEIYEVLNYDLKLKKRDALLGWGKHEEFFETFWTTLCVKEIPRVWVDELQEGGRAGIFRILGRNEVEGSYKDYLEKWWENVCLSVYVKEDSELIEISRMYDLFNLPYADGRYGEAGATWGNDLMANENRLLEALK